MAAVIVWPGRHGLRLNTAPPMPPAARATIMVSPTALERAAIRAATMPDTAAGKTMRKLVVRLRAPRPTEASRRELGTAYMASSEIEATSGVINTPTAKPADAMLKSGVGPGQIGSITVGARTVKAKKPRTTLGMAASTSRMGLTMRRVRNVAYSANQIAAPRPSGVATTMAMPAMMNVPVMIEGRSKLLARGRHDPLKSVAGSTWVM